MLLLFTQSALDILNVDGDDSIYPGQIGVVISGSSLNSGISSRIRYNTQILNMEAYNAGSSPTFNVPDLATFFSSGIPFGTVSFEILRAV